MKKETLEGILEKFKGDREAIAILVADFAGWKDLIPYGFGAQAMDYFLEHKLHGDAHSLVMCGVTMHRFIETMGRSINGDRDSDRREETRLGVRRAELALEVAETFIAQGLKGDACYYLDLASSRLPYFLPQESTRKFHATAMNFYRQMGNTQKAAEHAHYAGLVEESTQLYTSAMRSHLAKGNNYNAAVCAECAGLKEEAKRLHKIGMSTGKSNGRIYEAALSAEALGLEKEARELYRLEIDRLASAGNFESADRIVSDQHIPIPAEVIQRGIASLSGMGQHQAAAKVAENYGLIHTSISIHLEMNNPVAAAEVAERNERPSLAVGILKKAGMHSLADEVQTRWNSS